MESAKQAEKILEAQRQRALLNDTIEMLTKIQNDFAPSELGKQGDFGLMLKAARGEEGGNALVQLAYFKKGVLLEWYRSPYRRTRLVVLSIYYTTMNPDYGNFPRFKHDAERFKTDEARERLEEIAYIEEHKAEIIPIIRKMLPDDRP